MSNLSKLEFVALDISGKNYLSWILDAEMHLNAMNLGETITEHNESSTQDKAKAMIFLRHHLDEGLKNEYLTVKDPYVLWTNLKDRYDHQKTVILPKARHDWIHLRLQDFKSVTEYNSALFKIVSRLKLCGEHLTDADLLEKTYSTFHASNIVLQQQYRERRFQKYSELISCLLLAESNNELLMKNHQTHPTGSTPFPEINAVNKGHRGSFRGRGRGRGQGRGRSRQWSKRSAPYHHYKWNRNDAKHEGAKGVQNKPMKRHDDLCYRCGMKGHWERTCRTPKHLCDLYQSSVKGKGKEVETNLIENSDETNQITHLDVSDFFESPAGNVEQLHENVSVD